MTSEFAVSKREDPGGVARLVLHGEIDTDSSEAVIAIVANATRQDGVTAVVLDLHEVSFLAAAGIGALVEARARAVQHGLAFRVAGAHGIVRTVLEATALCGLLGVGAPEPRPLPIR